VVGIIRPFSSTVRPDGDARDGYGLVGNESTFRWWEQTSAASVT
jgi:hypothetical protein